MNELVAQHKETKLAISTETKELIQSSIADSTLERYRRLSEQIGAWLGGQMLTDGLLATLHHRASPARQIPCNDRPGGRRGEVASKESGHRGGRRDRQQNIGGYPP